MKKPTPHTSPGHCHHQSSWDNRDLFILLLAIALSTVVCLMNSWTPWADQLALIQCGRLGVHYPSIHQGIGSCLISALIPRSDPITMNTVLRITAMVLYLLSASQLGFHLLKTIRMKILFVAILVASYFPYVWLSSELIAGAFLCVAISLVHQKKRPYLTGVVLGFLSHTKPDLIIVSIALLFYAFFRTSNRKTALYMLLFMMGSMSLLILPGFIIKGVPYFQSGYERHWVSFGQHAANLFTGRQVWAEWQQHLSTIFPGADSLKEVLTMYPARYLEYLLLSIKRGILTIHLVGSWLLFSLPVMLVWILNRRIAIPSFANIIAVSAIGFLPMLFISYPHIRYMARYFPAFAILFLMLVDAIHRTTGSIGKRISLVIIYTSIGIYVAVRFAGLGLILSRAPVDHFWWAD